MEEEEEEEKKKKKKNKKKNKKKKKKKKKLLQPTPTRRADSFDNYRGTFYSFNGCTGLRNVTLEI
jgi:hypothetical protein